jgi:hypothetical protein
MEKKKYEKPIVLDLNGNAATGGPLGCFNGNSPGTFELCQTGTGVDTGLGNPCATGPAPGTRGSPLCFSGGSPMFCNGGSGGDPMPASCTSGPNPLF